MAFWLTAIIITGVFIVLGLIIFTIINNRGYTNKIRIRQKVGKDYRIIDDIAKVFTDPLDKSKKWKCKKTKLKVGLPRKCPIFKS